MAAPCIYIYYKGVKDAAGETVCPKENNELFWSIYNKVRHPQAAALQFQ